MTPSTSAAGPAPAAGTTSPRRRWPDDRRPRLRARVRARAAGRPGAQGHPGPGAALGVHQVPHRPLHRVDPAGGGGADDRHQRAVLGGDRQPVPHLQPGRPGHLQPRQHQPERHDVRRGGVRGAGRADDQRRVQHRDDPLVASLISFFLGQALLNSHHLGVSVAAPGALRSIVGAALYGTVAGMIGVALGALFRNTAAGIATFAGVFFVIPPLTGLLPASISGHLSQYLPSYAGEAVWGAARGVTNALSPWTGFALLCGYAVVLVAAAALRLRRVDA